MTATRLGRVQLRIMQILWERGRATARDITDAINESEPLAHSTVQTLLRGLEEKGAVAHQADGRTFVFFPLVEEHAYKQSATRDLVERVFGGSAVKLVAHLLAHDTVPGDELEQIRQLIEQQSKPSRRRTRKGDSA